MRWNALICCFLRPLARLAPHPKGANASDAIVFPTKIFSHLDAGRDGSYVLFSYGGVPLEVYGAFGTVAEARSWAAEVGTRKRVKLTGRRFRAGAQHERLLPQRRRAETFAVNYRNQLVTVTAGFHPGGELGEIFIATGKSGADIEFIARDAAVLPSLTLQHGVPPETIRHAVTRGASEEPASILGAVVDFIATNSFSGGV